MIPFKVHPQRSTPATKGAVALIASKPARATKLLRAKSFGDSSSSFLLMLDTQHFLVCWGLMVAFHACDIAFLVAMTSLYHWLLHDPYAQLRFLDNLVMDMSARTLDLMNWVFIVLTGLHSLVLLRVLYRSCIKTQRFVPSLAALVPPFGKSKPSGRGVVAHDKTARVIERYSSHIRALESVHKWFRQVVFIDGKYFDDFFLVQECFEVISQIYQARQMSVFIATRWINNVFVGMIFLNCFSTPVIHRLVPGSRMASRRLLEITISAFLNFINSVVLPFVIFMQYVHAYDPRTRYFARSLLFDDVWYVKAVRENQQLFITSFVDFLSTLWPHCSILSCLMVCESVIHQNRPSNQPKTIAVASMTKQDSPRPKTPHQASRMIVHSVLRTFLCLAGVVVLTIHIDAQSVPQLAGCKYQATPWLNGHKSSCVVLNLNCYEREIQGSQTQVARILDHMNTKTLFSLIVSHCPSLEIPPIIQQFHSLDGIEIYNSTLHDWPLVSALPDEDFPMLEYVFFLRSTISKIPDVLVQNALPSFLAEMVFVETNLTFVPHQVVESWKDLECVRMEECGLQEIPEGIGDLLPPYLYLNGNPIHNTTNDLFANDEMLSLALSRTPLAHLPDQTTGNLQQLYKLILEFTQLEEVPTFIQEWYLQATQQGNYVAHSLFGSPFCNKPIPDGDDHRKARDYQQQVCSSEIGSTMGVFPMDLVAPQRPL